jgi:hypothetical protein
MASRATRAARAKKREKIRLGPSETATAYLNLLGVEIEMYPPVTGVWPPLDLKNQGETMLKARMNMKYWHARVIDTPHITKNLFCVDEAQWIAEIKALRQKADKFKREHGRAMFIPGTQMTATEVRHRYNKSYPNIQKLWKMNFAQAEARIVGHMLHDQIFIDESTKLKE